MVESLPYNEKVDVYAFGLLLWEMLEDRRVFDGMGVSDFYERVVNAGARPNLDPAWPQVTAMVIVFVAVVVSRFFGERCSVSWEAADLYLLNTPGVCAV